jgi:hypothetical protein
VAALLAATAIWTAAPAAAGPEEAGALGFLDDHPELRERLAAWERDAPPAVAERIAARRGISPPGRNAAAHALGEMGPEARGAIAALLQALRPGRPSTFDLHLSKDRRLPAVTTRALAAIGEPAVEPLIAALEAGYSPDRVAAALGEIGDPRALCALQTKASAVDGATAVAAAEALRTVAERASVAALGAVLETGSDADRSEAAAALNRTVLGPPDPEPLAVLVTHVAAGDDAGLANQLCWEGSLAGHAAAVLPACERAVALEPDNGAFRDSRGLARALTGNAAGAAEDFRVFAEWGQAHHRSAEAVALRRNWIERLEAGDDPFASALDALRR